MVLLLLRSVASSISFRCDGCRSWITTALQGDGCFLFRAAVRRISFRPQQTWVCGPFFFYLRTALMVPSVGDRTKIYDYTIHDVLRVLYAVDSVRVPPCSLNKVRDRTSKICNYQWCSGKNYTVHAVLVLCVLVLLVRVPL